MSAFEPLPARLASIGAAVFPDEPSTAPSLNWAIIGAGYIAGLFAADLQFTQSAAVAVGSRDLTKGQAFADQFGIPFVGSYEEAMSRPDVDAVYIATPHTFHKEQALLAINAGKAVMIEKPLAVNAGEAAEIRAAAEAKGVLVMEAMWSRFLPHYALLRAIVESGELGEIKYVRAEHFQTLRGTERMERPDLAGGALLDLGVYPASFIEMLLGAPKLIHASGHLTEAGVDEDSIAVLDYPAATAVLAAHMGASSQVAAEVAFTRGQVVLERQFYRPTEIKVVWNGVADGPQNADSAEPYTEVWSDVAVDPRGGGLEYEAAAFARALKAGLTELPEHGWSSVTNVLEIMDEVRRQVGVVYPFE